MREKIIQYLQRIQCEWFPVEWDSFAANFLGIEFSYPSIENIKIKYSFFGTGCYDVLVSKDYLDDQPRITWNFWTLDRCKTLLLNAVRSIDEPKRRGDGINIEGNGHHSGYTVATGGELIQIYYHTKDGASIAWENGEFK